MRAKVDDLKKRLEDTIARNAAADELERIPGDQLIVDAEFHARLVAEGDERVEEVRTTLMGENLRREYDAHRIKSECWDTMATHGVRDLGVQSSRSRRSKLSAEEGRRGDEDRVEGVVPS